MMQAARDVRQVLLIAVLAFLVAAAAAVTWRVVPPAIAPRINIRWAPGIDDTQRAAAERRFDLRRGEVKDGRTWAYDLGDVSRGNVRALVADPAVEDTHYINRAAGTVWRTAPRGSEPVGGLLSRVRDSWLITWAATTGATTAGVAILWLVTDGRHLPNR
jgi:hypothetical protein